MITNRRAKLPLLVSLLLLFIIAFIITSLANAGERFQPRGCEYSVEFPGKPKIYDVIIPLVGKVQNAEYRGGSGKASDSYFFLVEGMPVSRQEIFKYHKDIESYLSESAHTYAEANGIQLPEFKYYKDSLGHGIVMRGYKTISGIRVIYSSMSLLGERSIIFLRAGCAAELFPPPGMTEFMKSVRRD